MKHEICPKCGVIRECKIWKHCHCGHDFEPGHVYERATHSVVETDTQWTDAAYTKGVVGLGGFGSLALLFNEYVVKFYPLQFAGGLALAIAFWLPTPRLSDKKSGGSTIANNAPFDKH
jgi:hypothetical protein